MDYNQVRKAKKLILHYRREAKEALRRMEEWKTQRLQLQRDGKTDKSPEMGAVLVKIGEWEGKHILASEAVDSIERAVIESGWSGKPIDLGKYQPKP